MMRPERAVKESFAYVYDALYGGDTAFLRAQLDFLQCVFGPPSGPLLDIGCGTGIHVAGLGRLGYSIVGTDVDPLMLLVARRKSRKARLVLANVRRLPFRWAEGSPFAGALCLESPLAYMMKPEVLSIALRSIGGTLRDAGKLVIDVYDYPGTLGERPSGSHEAYFETESMRVSVIESHRYEKRRALWTMRQEFEVEEEGGIIRFEVVHKLRIREMDEYGAALQATGFRIEEALTAYPNTPESLSGERRFILVARR